MPVRVSQQPPTSNNLSNSSTTTTTTTTTYSLRRDSPASSRGDDSSTSSISLDGRQRKRLNKTTSESHTLPRSKPSLREPRSSPKTTTTTTTQRAQRHEQKPISNKTSDFQNSRSDVNTSVSSSNALANNNNPRTFLHPPNGHAGANITTFYAFGQNSLNTQQPAEPLGEPFDFSPSGNLEDIHRSIIDTEQLSQFPTPRRGRGNTDAMEENHHRTQPTTMESRPAVLRRPSVSNKNVNSQGPTHYEQRSRRQSNAPTHQSSNNSLSSTYRKSMATTDTESSKRRRPSAANNSLTPPVPKEYVPGSGYSSKTSDAVYKVPASTRTAKSKSLQPPARHQGQSKPSLSPEHGRAQSMAFPPKSPRSPSLLSKLGAPKQGGIPLSTSSRRISTIPHASGLGARTVSPTDARRAKRLSAIHSPTPPSLPLPVEDARSAPGSPSMIPRKSVTPSSSGTTPEPQRKSYSSGLSTASTNTSARTSIGSLQPKLSQNLAVSRLPKPPRASVERDEEIPPVPPLPKELASPMVANFSDAGYNSNSNGRKSGNSTNGYFGPRKDSLPTEPELFDMESDASSRPAVPEKPKFSEKIEKSGRTSKEKSPEKTTRADRETRRKRGMTLGGMNVGQGMQTLESKSSSSSLRKKDLVPLRLPPLNLLPLSTPTIARVNALGPHSDSDELTPPQKRSIKTPSTPMTASKAGFFGKGRDRDEAAYNRATSSFNHPTQPAEDSPSSLSLRAGSSASSSIPVSASSRMGRQTISPYVSHSLSKGTPTGEFEGEGKDHKGRLIGVTLGGGATRETNNKSRSRKSQESVGSAPVAEETPGTPTSASSIRRKLSLSWKKSSSSKHSHAATERAEEYSTQKYDTAQKFDSMPPPKLPSSATWSATTSHPPSPVRIQKVATSGEGQARRKSSIGNGVNLPESWSKETIASEKRSTESVVSQQPPPTPAKNSTGSSILGPMTKMLSSKHSLGQMRHKTQPAVPAHADPTMDHDDLMAEDEMRKIASKRKNLDAMAQELEELKRRATPKERVSPPQALRSIPLNIFERGEIVDYKEIYFCGTSDAKKHVGDLNSTTLPNFGYDDERGDYMIVKGDHLAYRYEVVDVLGKGSFGQVVRCVDHKTGGLVAIKIIRNKKRFHQQALVEVNILQKLKEWDPHGKHSLINFTQSFYFRGHLCISTELLGMNLYEFIKSNDFRGFSLRLIRRMTKQMLSSLVLLKGKRVIHCDLKPENILLAHPMRSEIKVIDFGSSCFEHEKVYTYIQSRFYRSPEVILGMTYGMPIDMWSLGCILAELFTGYPIFPGENEQEQLACIMEVFGPPEKHLIEKSTRKKLFFDSFGKPRMIVSSKGKRRRPSSKTLQYVLKCDDEAFLDFIARCLRWDPEKRLKPDEAMHHDFITGRKATRPRTATESPIKRFNTSSYATSTSRPLPDPPATKPRITHGSSTTQTSNASPMKGYSSVKRNPSTAGAGAGAISGTKRNSMGGAAVQSGLPRVTAAQRSVSGKVPTPSSSSHGLRGSAGTSSSIRLVRDDESSDSQTAQNTHRNQNR
ncbi:uncharacterized protein H6S33_011571 [Morchella sextelata]|uniref:uncharacterized protein n=1 Tax=Morchella sextelata TaxID=1174677 RepID=UPI001D03724A|nr:uncharacterized protein H6S33_011571 [Morchella sextelata]KAH0611144.1 hypothetical protein H6S33_011571 [Morchella sextelata]